MQNMLPPFGANGWRSDAPRADIAPAFDISPDGLSMRAVHGGATVGKYLSQPVSVTPGQTYRFACQYMLECAQPSLKQVHAMLTWQDACGKPLRRDYASDRAHLPGGAVELSRTLEAPEGAAQLVSELVFKWCPDGRVTFTQAVLTPAAAIAPRRVRIAGAYAKYPGNKEGNLQTILRMMDEAGKQGADIVCLTEAANALNCTGPLYDRCIRIPGPETQLIGQMAKHHHMYAVMGLYQRQGDVCYNVSALFGRDGQVEGIYRKVQLPLSEVEDGLTPGDEYPTFKTDFGTIGMMVCWDQGYPEIARSLALNGAEIIFVPTMWPSDIQGPSRAAENSIYLMAVARPYEEYPVRVFGPYGQVIAKVPGDPEGLASGVLTCDIDLNQRHYQHWLSVGDCLGEAKPIFRTERRNDVYAPVLGE
nr:carbon-nitrogen hydrolase family protein [bacterium]